MEVADYVRLDDTGLRAWIATVPSLNSRLGGTPDRWKVAEVSDGNLNVVYVVNGPAGGICVKQALPYVRAAGEGWPMPLERAHFEQLYLRACEPHTQGLAPALLHYDPRLFVLAMELLDRHVVLRRAFVTGHRYPNVARRVAEYVARKSFATSVISDSFEHVNGNLAAFSANHALTRVTVDLIFTHPYIEHERNRWTSPQLDDTIAQLRGDVSLKLAVARLCQRFLTAHEALLHGDLHTGSVMVNETDTRVIDAEFAIYGPIAFDLGMFIGNLLMAYFSQPGHEGRRGERADYGEWILGQIGEFWYEFVQRFETLWRERRGGDVYVSAFFTTPTEEQAWASERRKWFDGLFAEVLGYAGVEIVRRIVGFAHNLDFESIENPEVRAALERRALSFARMLILRPAELASPEELIRRARGETMGLS